MILQTFLVSSSSRVVRVPSVQPGIFTSRPSDTQIIALDTLEDVQREVTKSVARYGSEMSGLLFPRAANVTITAPLHVYSSTITSQIGRAKGHRDKSPDDR